MSNKKIYQVEECPPLSLAFPLSFQHLFAMFGASVIVPMLLGVNPAVVLFMNGVGTLLFILITKGKAPAFLGSSFAFIAPATIIISNPNLGYKYALGGFIVSGLVFCGFAMIIKFFGTKWIDRVLPPAALGPVIALIGLELAGVAAQNAGIVRVNDIDKISTKAIIVFLITLLTAIIGSITFRKFLAVIPILIAIIVGYIAAAIVGIIDFTPITESNIFVMPNFQAPSFNMDAILIILPATLVVLSEHIGHQLVTGKIIGRDLIKDPGLHRTLLGDGISTALSGFCGSVPTTTYGENIGVMAITGVYSVWVIGGAAILSILISFVGKFSGAIQTIPGPVMGGVSFLLYGMIASSGIRLLVDAKVDYSKSENLILTSVIFITGLSGVAIRIGEVELKGMALATIVGMVLSLLLYILKKFKFTNGN